MCTVTLHSQELPARHEFDSSRATDSVEPTNTFLLASNHTAQPRAAQGGTSSKISEYWNRVYSEEGVVAPPSQAAVASAPKKEGADNLLDHLIFRFGFDYTRNFVSFRDRLTRTLVIDESPGIPNFPDDVLFADLFERVTEEGFPFPQAFEDDDERFSSYLVLGTRGYGNSRVNTYFSIIRQQDLDGTPDGSPFQSILDSFDGDDRTELVNGYLELTSLGSGEWARSSLRIGRQFVFDYTPQLLGSPVVDGARLRYQGARADIEVFTGRRVNFFSNPDDDLSAGGSLTYEFLPGTSGTMNYFFLPELHRYAFEAKHQFGNLLSDAFLTFRNEHAVEIGVRGWYSSPASPWSLRGGLSRRLTDEDFSFDIFRKRDDLRDRLRLFEVDQATLLHFDADYQFASWLTLGGGLEAQFLDSGEGPFDTSYVQATLRALLTPFDRWDYLLQYRYRNIERDSLRQVAAAALFDDISRAGETDYHEVSGDIHYRLGSRASVRAGGYVGVFDSRNRLAEVDDLLVTGGYIRTKVRLLKIVDLKLEYGIDRGNREFTPEIDVQHTLRVGFDITY